MKFDFPMLGSNSTRNSTLYSNIHEEARTVMWKINEVSCQLSVFSLITVLRPVLFTVSVLLVLAVSYVGLQEVR